MNGQTTPAIWREREREKQHARWNRFRDINLTCKAEGLSRQDREIQWLSRRRRRKNYLKLPRKYSSSIEAPVQYRSRFSEWFLSAFRANAISSRVDHAWTTETIEISIRQERCSGRDVARGIYLAENHGKVPNGTRGWRFPRAATVVGALDSPAALNALKGVKPVCSRRIMPEPYYPSHTVCTRVRNVHGRTISGPCVCVYVSSMYRVERSDSRENSGARILRFDRVQIAARRKPSTWVKIDMSFQRNDTHPHEKRVHLKRISTRRRDREQNRRERESTEPKLADLR